MGFFEKWDRRKRTPRKAATQQDKDRAKKLIAILLAGKRITVQPRTDRWADEFRLLREMIEDEAQIDLALDFLEGQVKRVGRDSRFPPIYGAAAFRRHFLWLQEAHQKWLKKNPQIEVSPEAAELAKWLSRLHWPKGSSTNLPAAVQTSLNALAELSAKLKKRQKELSASRTWLNSRELSEKGFIDRVIAHLASPKDFVRRWFEQLYKRVRQWKEWSGELHYFQLTTDSSDFQKLGRQWAIEYAGNPKAWDRLVEKLG